MKSFTLPSLSVCLFGLFLINAVHISGFNNDTQSHNDVSSNRTEATALGFMHNPMEEMGNETELGMEFPHLVVANALDQPCLLAIINASLRISYRVRPEAVQDTYIAISDVELPDHTEVVGQCGHGFIEVLYDWDNSTYQVSLNFVLHEDPNPEDDNSTAPWTLDSIKISFDLASEDAFPGAKDNKIVSVHRGELGLFETPSDKTMICDNEIKVQVGQDEPGVEIIFTSIEIAAFGVTSEEFPEQVVHCTDGSLLRPEDDIVVPLIVACSLSLVVVLVVIAYAISRKVQEARDQTQYKPMP